MPFESGSLPFCSVKLTGESSVMTCASARATVSTYGFSVGSPLSKCPWTWKASAADPVAAAVEPELQNPVGTPLTLDRLCRL